MPVYVRQLPLGPMKNFVYLVGDSASAEVVVVDPAWDVDAIEAAARADGKRISAVFASHCHGDHINGLPELLARHDLPVYVQEAEVDFSTDLRELGDALRPLADGAAFEVGTARFKSLHTPGHTPGSQCLWAGDALVSGDTVFVNGCGRCDFPGSDPAAMHRTLTQVLRPLPDETRLFPGHDYGDVKVSSLGREREQNPYFQLPELADFVRYRMRPRV